MTTEPSADTMERARALRSAVVWASNEAVEIIAQVLHDAQEEARREQRERDAQWHDGQAWKANLAAEGADARHDSASALMHRMTAKAHEDYATAIRNQESPT